MADDQTPTPSSEPTPTPAASDPPADPAPAGDPPAAPEPKGDDLGGTALGDAGDPPANPDGDPAEPKAAVPETYELTAPEGFEKLDDAAIAAATPVFKELGLSNEQANKLMPVVGEYAKRIISERDQAFIGQILEQRKAWLETAKADPEIGGPNWGATIQSAARAFDLLGFPKGSPLRVSLDESGYGNNPELIRFAAKVGEAIGEDSDFVRGDANAGVTPKTDAELFYGKKG